MGVAPCKRFDHGADVIAMIDRFVHVVTIPPGGIVHNSDKSAIGTELGFGKSGTEATKTSISQRFQRVKRKLSGEMENTLTRPNYQKRAVRFAWATIVWNIVEAVVAIAAGAAASSIALVGFGLDSTVEVVSAMVIVWQFRGLAEDRERRALKLIAVSFFALAAYVGVQAIIDLVRRSEPNSSTVGIGLAIASLIVMPLLARAKRRNGDAMGSATVVADSNQTKLCAYLSGILLAGLVLNATAGWWWADPIAALGIAALAVNEGLEAWRGEICDDCC